MDYVLCIHTGRGGHSLKSRCQVSIYHQELYSCYRWVPPKPHPLSAWTVILYSTWMGEHAMYDISFKLKAVEYADKPSKESATRKFCLDAKRICEWCSYIKIGACTLNVREQTREEKAKACEWRRKRDSGSRCYCLANTIVSYYQCMFSFPMLLLLHSFKIHIRPMPHANTIYTR